MGEQDEQQIWQDLVGMIKDLAPEERRRYMWALLVLVHDLRQNIGIIYSAEGLLRRKIGSDPQEAELLDAIHKSSQRVINLLTAFSEPLDADITIPVRKPPK
jgi:signal transduction histidine kinase